MAGEPKRVKDNGSHREGKTGRPTGWLGKGTVVVMAGTPAIVCGGSKIPLGITACPERGPAKKGGTLGCGG